MPEIPQNITREHLLKAIERIDQEGVPGNAHSSTYDVLHDGKAYPPKLVVSWANVFANGEELDRSSFAGGKGTDCFKLLEKEGFSIEAKASSSATESDWLLTWNPSKWSAGGVGNKELSLGLQVGEQIDWRCSSKQPKAGDSVFLIRTGVKPKGIVAKGTVLKESFMQVSDEDSAKSHNHITVAFSEIRESCDEGLLPFVLLKQEMGEQDWSPQSSGISIKPDIQQELNELWEAGRGKHSLRQFVEWTATSEAHRRTEWLQTYTEVYEITRSFVNDKQDITQDLLERLWKPARNGVANVNPGPMSSADYDNNIEALKKLTLAVRDKPDYETYLATYTEFETLKTQGSIRMMYKSVINRVFAGLYPDRFTSGVSLDKCKKLLKALIQDFQLKADMADDWFHVNEQIKHCMEEAELDANQLLRNNIAMWELYACLYESTSGKANEISEPESAYDTKPISGEPAMVSLNQILYGPPGTGKTYCTIDKALEILDLPFIEKVKTEEDGSGQARVLLKKRFDELKAQGRIHFVTFHQSFSYEDFVEGIKASTLETGISYSVESGIFKKACTACRQEGNTLDLDDALNQFIEEIAEQTVTLKTPRGKEFTAFYKGGNTTITCIPKASEEKRELPASIDHIKQVLKGFRPDNIYCESYVNGIVSHVMSKLPAPSSSFYVGQAFNKYRVTKLSDQIVEITKPNGKVLPYPMSVLNELKGFVESGKISVKDIGNKGWQELESDIEPYLVNGYDNLVPQLVEYLIDGGKTEPLSSIEDLPVVLIIDEINRGNISSIFGELITLIEPSKRAGAEEALSVTLPYSKETFQVPSNLYLIGTMNTADRSLALMDTALRRRFDFVEMMPDVDLLDGVEVNGINIKAMLTRMNKRIEVLYDREHTLGHAFFMPLTSGVDEEQRFKLLQSIFSNKILPLLEEYFFEDWAKIRLVLGDDNKATEHQFISENGKDYDAETLFGKNVDLGYELEDQKSYTRNDAALVHLETYLGIYAD